VEREELVDDDRCLRERSDRPADARHLGGRAVLRLGQRAEPRSKYLVHSATRRRAEIGTIDRHLRRGLRAALLWSRLDTRTDGRYILLVHTWELGGPVVDLRERCEGQR